MPNAASIALLSLLLVACGNGSDAPASPPAPAAPSAPTTSPASAGVEGARATVEAYMVAAKKPDEAAMLALGTPEWQQKEKTWKKGFTHNIVTSGFALKSYEVREPEIEGEKASISVRAVFVDAGKDNREGMRFSLERRDGRWWITDLR